MPTQKLNMVQSINLALRLEMRKNPNIVLIGEDVGKNGGVFRATDGLLAEFGDSRVTDTPLAELTLRRYEKPYDLSKRELVKKLCLSLGLLNPGDSRDVIVDVFFVLLDAKKQSKQLSNSSLHLQLKHLKIPTHS